MNSAWRWVKGKTGRGRAEGFFLINQGLVWEFEKTKCHAGPGGGWWQDKAPLIALKMEKQMQRSGKSIVAGDSKYSKVLSLLGHWCHVETARLTLIWEFADVQM